MKKQLKSKWALVTGASSGIGVDLADHFAAAGCNLVLTARRKDRLENLKVKLEKKYQVEIIIISNDLSVLNGAKDLLAEISKNDIQISILVNNAGIGLNGKFSKIDLEKQLGMMQLNMASLTELTYQLLPNMKEKNEGWILNVASVYAFRPGPGFAIYAASKAFVLSLSEALHFELKNSGINSTVLCPGATRTEFWEVAGNTTNPLMNAIMMESKTVAKIGFEGLLKNKAIVIPGVFNKFLIFIQRFSPRPIITWVSSKFAE